MPKVDTKAIDRDEIFRYIINGVVATAIHFTILTINIKVFEFSSAGVANFVAAIFGITASFVGSRYFVYRDHSGSLYSHAIKFVILYGMIALLHGAILYIWTDIYHYAYEIGFLLATMLQILLSYIGNKVLVFK
jgi:putative flippase GtrA